MGSTEQIYVSGLKTEIIIGFIFFLSWIQHSIAAPKQLNFCFELFSSTITPPELEATGTRQITRGNHSPEEMKIEYTQNRLNELRIEFDKVDRQGSQSTASITAEIENLIKTLKILKRITTLGYELKSLDQINNIKRRIEIRKEIKRLRDLVK